MAERTCPESGLLYSISNPVLTSGLCRPRIESSVTQHDRHAQRLITDLIDHREKIFKDLKRQNGKKPRPESLDESQRRVRYEARSRAVSAAAKSPRMLPVDAANGTDKSPTHGRRLSGISGILAHKSPTIALEPGDTISLDNTLPAGGTDEASVLDSNAPIEVTVTDESTPVQENELDTPTKKPSLGRSGRITGARGLQRHGKRISLQQGAESISGVQDPDAAAVAANVRRSLEDTRLVGVTLTDGPVQE